MHGERVEGGEAGGAAGWAGAVAQGVAEVGEGDTEIVEVRAQGDEGAKLTLLALPEAAIEVSAEEVADGFGRVMDGAGAEAGWAWEGVALSIMRAGQGMPAEERGEASSGVGILGAALVVLAAVALTAAAAGSAAATAVSVAVVVVVIIIAATAPTTPHNRYRDGAPLPGFFWLFAIGELVSNKPCAILAASWSVSGDGQCRDETR